MLDPMKCMKDGVPLSLVIDLFEPMGPDASRIYADEPADTSWTVDPHTHVYKTDKAPQAVQVVEAA